ncbi:MAG: TetR/AcrR family transcriptional regulator [Clostridiales bacterium]|nr:TetR/AcrR family transcriptional regulator [Clostridiales bacterium]
MPKVTKEYINRKRSEILEAAFTVFQQKTLYEMTMLDVIKQAGLSKGGIYRYFSDIDDVIIELINRETQKKDYRGRIEKIINNNNDETVIEELLCFLGRYINETVDTLGKIQFELTVLIANHPDKAKKISSRLTEQENGQYLIESLFQMIIEGVNKGEFKPETSLEDIFSYIRVYIEGVVKVVVLEKCYRDGQNSIDPEKMMMMLSRTIIGMLKQ